MHSSYQDRRSHGGYHGGYPGEWLDGHRQVGYEYRQPTSAHHDQGYVQRHARYPTPEPMGRMSSSTAYSAHNLPRRSLTPFPGRGHPTPPFHYPSQQGSYYSNHDRYPEGHGRAYDMNSRSHIDQWRDPAYQQGYPSPYEQRYRGAPAIPGRREGSFIGGRQPMEGYAMGERQASGLNPPRDGSYPHQNYPQYEEEYFEEDEWDEHDHHDPHARGQYIKQRDGGFHVSGGLGDGYESAGGVIGQGPMLKGEYSRRRGHRGYAGERGLEDDPGYGSGEGESLVSEDWGGTNHSRYPQGTPHPAPGGGGGGGGWNQRMPGAPWPTASGEDHRHQGFGASRKFRDEWR